MDFSCQLFNFKVWNRGRGGKLILINPQILISTWVKKFHKTLFAIIIRAINEVITFHNLVIIPSHYQKPKNSTLSTLTNFFLQSKATQSYHNLMLAVWVKSVMEKMNDWIDERLFIALYPKKRQPKTKSKLKLMNVLGQQSFMSGDKKQL